MLNFVTRCMNFSSALLADDRSKIMLSRVMKLKLQKIKMLLNPCKCLKV